MISNLFPAWCLRTLWIGAISLLNSPGDPVRTAPPELVKRALSEGSVKPALNSALPEIDLQCPQFHCRARECSYRSIWKSDAFTMGPHRSKSARWIFLSASDVVPVGRYPIVSIFVCIS